MLPRSQVGLEAKHIDHTPIGFYPPLQACSTVQMSLNVDTPMGTPDNL